MTALLNYKRKWRICDTMNYAIHKDYTFCADVWSCRCLLFLKKMHMFFLTSFSSSQVHCGLSVGTGQNLVDQRLRVCWLMWVQLSHVSRLVISFSLSFFLPMKGIFNRSIICWLTKNKICSQRVQLTVEFWVFGTSVL